MTIPLWLRLAFAAALLAVFTGVAWFIHHTIWKSGYNAATQKMAAKAEELRVMQQEGIDNVSSTFVAKSEKGRKVVESNQAKVSEYVPVTDCPLPPGFRLFYNAAATGEEIDDSRRADATAVAAQDVARTTGENFAVCRYDQARLEALQEIVKKMNGE